MQFIPRLEAASMCSILWTVPDKIPPRILNLIRFLLLSFSVADDDEADFWLQGWSAQFRLKGTPIFYLSSLGHHGISLVYNVQIEDLLDRWMLLWPTLVLFSFKIWLMVKDITKAWYRSWNVVSLWRRLMITIWPFVDIIGKSVNSFWPYRGRKNGLYVVRWNLLLL